MKKSKDKNIHFSGTRKSAVARATLKQGTGKVKINGIALNHFGNKTAQLKIQEPLILGSEYLPKIDFEVSTFGGGILSQAEASRLAIAKCLNEFSKNKLKEIFLEYDRTLLVADVRQRESRKPNTRGNARAKRQKSYR